MDELKEKLAAIEHERWADWQKYVHLVYFRGDLPDFIPRWDTQINTPYAELSDAEKASDMEQVDRYWHLIQTYCDKQSRGARKELLKELREVAWRRDNLPLFDELLSELESAPKPSKETAE